MAKKDGSSMVTWLFNAGLIATFLAGVGAVGFDIYLASTQWILVAILMVVMAIYLKK